MVQDSRGSLTAQWNQSSNNFPTRTLLELVFQDIDNLVDNSGEIERL
jgi:hypothetical protein